MKTIKAEKNALRINEIFYSIQGESTYAGLPCVFVRLTWCNLRCSWCDTEYAFYEGDWSTFDDIIAEIKSYKCNLVEVTGGEPLLQENVIPFMQRLCDEGFKVLLETGGHMDISKVDKRVERIMDIKCPYSNESEKNYWPNVQQLKNTDQVKFVIANREDYDYMKKILNEYKIADTCPVLVSPVFDKIDLQELANWVLKDKLPVRMQLQMHKFIWAPETKGV